MYSRRCWETVPAVQLGVRTGEPAIRRSFGGEARPRQLAAVRTRDRRRQTSYLHQHDRFRQVLLSRCHPNLGRTEDPSGLRVSKQLLTPLSCSSTSYRVKSLVREFDEAIKTPPPANPAVSSPQSPLSPVSPPSSSRPAQGTHTRRAASVSYSSSNPAPLASPPFTYKSSAFSPTSNAMRGAAPGLDGLGPIPGGGASVLLNKRRESAPMASPSPSAQRSVSGSSAASLENVREDAAERAEEDDVFLPLASDPQTPFTASLISSNGRTPTIPAAGQQHQRKHSRIHERNLSAFFPRPGQAPGTGYGDTYEDPNASPYQPPAVRDMPPARDDATPEDARGKSRRGHHHRHSLSHNFAASSFLDPTSPTSDFSASPSSAYGPSSPFPMSPPASSGAAFLPAQSNRARYAHLPSALRFLVFVVLYLPLQTQLALALASAQVLLGATLWITGQSGESLAVTGLGYLVVFDGIGGLSRTFVEGGAGVDHMWALWGSPRLEKGVRLPFGCVFLPQGCRNRKTDECDGPNRTQRLVTLSHFSQSIYLLFSAVYVCKESVEHVLLLHGGTEAEGAHGAGHGMGHGDGGGGAAASTTLDGGFVFFLRTSRRLPAHSNSSAVSRSRSCCSPSRRYSASPLRSRCGTTRACQTLSGRRPSRGPARDRARLRCSTSSEIPSRSPCSPSAPASPLPRS